MEKQSDYEKWSNNTSSGTKCISVYFSNATARVTNSLVPSTVYTQTPANKNYCWVICCCKAVFTLPVAHLLLQWEKCHLLCKVIYKHLKAETSFLTFHSPPHEILLTVAMLSSWFMCSSTCLILHNITFVSSHIRDQTSPCLMARPLTEFCFHQSSNIVTHRLSFPPFQYYRHLEDKDSPAWWERSRRRKPWHSRRWWSTWLAPWCPRSTPTTSATPALPPELTSEPGQPIKAWRFLHLHSLWFWLSSKEKQMQKPVQLNMSVPLMRRSSTVFSPRLDPFSRATRPSCHCTPRTPAFHLPFSLWGRDLCLLDFHLPLKAVLGNTEDALIKQVFCCLLS